MRTALAIDLGGTEVRAALVAEDGTRLARCAEPTQGQGGATSVLAQLERMARQMQDQARGSTILGLGVGVPGPVDAARGLVLFAPNVGGLADLPMAALLQERLGCPVQVENDANAAAVGEWAYGAGIGTRDMVYVTVSTGIGGGIISDGRVLRGRRGFAGEVGHTTISDRPIPCPCGNTGCWEALASGSALARFANAAAATEPTVLPRDGCISARDVAEAAAAGDALACRLLDDEAAHLGAGFANLLHLFAPERLVVGGGVSACLEAMRPGIVATVRRRAMAAYRDTPIVAAALGPDSGLAGAARLVFAAGV